MLDDLDAAGLPYRLLFLEADDSVLINRFKETRRRHPLANGGSVEAALARERTLLAPLKERADVSIDTTDLSAARLRKVVADKMLPHGRPGKLAVTFMTLRLQARHAARRATSPSTSASSRTRTTRRSCASRPGSTRT